MIAPVPDNLFILGELGHFKTESKKEIMRQETKKNPHFRRSEGGNKNPAATYSPVASTIGAGGLSYCVRNGNRRDPSARATRKNLPSLTCTASGG